MEITTKNHPDWYNRIVAARRDVVRKGALLLHAYKEIKTETETEKKQLEKFKNDLLKYNKNWSDESELNPPYWLINDEEFFAARSHAWWVAKHTDIAFLSSMLVFIGGILTSAILAYALMNPIILVAIPILMACAELAIIISTYDTDFFLFDCINRIPILLNVKIEHTNLFSIDDFNQIVESGSVPETPIRHNQQGSQGIFFAGLRKSDDDPFLPHTNMRVEQF